MALSLNIMPINTYSTKTLGLVDISVYDPVTPSNETLEITPANYPKKAISVTHGQAWVFTANDLGIDCDSDCLDLPDGMYTVKYSISPNETNYIECCFIRVELLKCKYQKAFLKIEQDCRCSPHSQIKKELWDIEMLIEGAVASANSKDDVSARMMYRKADDALDRILSDCNCKCN